MIDINEMAYAVYNATINPKQRKDVEKSYGKALSQQWHKLNELCMDLKKYYKMKKSSRKEIHNQAILLNQQHNPILRPFQQQQLP